MASSEGVGKAPTGVAGFDRISNGGLPRGRATLVCGGPGTGKTLFGLAFLDNGIEQGETGVLVSVEEPFDQLAAAVTSVGHDLHAHVDAGRLAVCDIGIDALSVAEVGDYDLSGLVARIDRAIDDVGATRVTIDTIDVLFMSLSNERSLRLSMLSLFDHLRDRGITTVVTGEKGTTDGLTRHGLEEYVSDCVVTLENVVDQGLATRYLRIVKCRGGGHETDRIPFFIDDDGLQVLPVTEAALDYRVMTDRVTSGVEDLDAMLNGGYLRGSTVLISGSAGTGKSSLGASFAHAAAAAGERTLHVSFEESPAQIVRNMRSIGVDLEAPELDSRLMLSSVRPTQFGTETHLARIVRGVAEHDASTLVIDPVTSLLHVGRPHEVRRLMTRLVDELKARGVTAVFTAFLREAETENVEDVAAGVSSTVDVWIHLRNIEHDGERNRLIHVLKARGMAHSNQVREFVLSDGGIELMDVYLGPAGVLTGSARVAQEARDERELEEIRQRISRRERELETLERTLGADIERMKASYETQRADVEAALAEARLLLENKAYEARLVARSRGIADHG